MRESEENMEQRAVWNTDPVCFRDQSINLMVHCSFIPGPLQHGRGGLDITDPKRTLAFNVEI